MTLEIANLSERKRIEKATNKYPADEWHRHVKGASLVCSAYNGQDCTSYALGRKRANPLLKKFPEIDDPQEGDIALYCIKMQERLYPLHVGIYQKDGTIVSKWGIHGPVLKHPIDSVPILYGSTVHFRRPPKNEAKKNPDIR
jgi:hypothetical protein